MKALTLSFGGVGVVFIALALIVIAGYSAGPALNKAWEGTGNVPLTAANVGMAVLVLVVIAVVGVIIYRAR